MKNYLTSLRYATDESGGGAGGDAGQSDSSSTPSGGAPPVTSTSPEGGTESKPFVLSDDKGNLAENWWKQYPELEPYGSTLQNFKTIQGLGKSFANTKAMVGKKFEPGQFADEHDEAEFYRKLGVPDNAEGYELKKPENFPADQQYNEEQVKWFANVAKEAKLTKAQATMIRDKFAEIQINAFAEAQKAHEMAYEEAQKALVAEWGSPESTTYKAELAYAQKAIDALEFENGKPVRAEIEKMGLQNYPPLFRLLAMMGRNVGESELAGVGINSSGMTKDQLQARINEIKVHPGFLDKAHPQHNDLMNEKAKLYALLYPEPQKGR